MEVYRKAHHKFSHGKIEVDLEWVLQFWNKSREAEPVTNPNKCARCEYLAECQKVS